MFPRSDATHGETDAAATIHGFLGATTTAGFDRWITNRHSDALYPDAAMRERVIGVPEGTFRAKAGAAVSHEVGLGGDEYDRVPAEFEIDSSRTGMSSYGRHASLSTRS